MWTRQGTHFVVDAPGIDREAMKVEVAKRSLIISGIKRKDDLLLERETKVKRKERPAGPFVRKFKLPADADLDRAYSTYRDGVLHVTVPRRPAHPEAPGKADVITIPVHDQFSCKTAQPADAEVRKPCSEINPEKSVPPKVAPVRVPVGDAETASKLAGATGEGGSKGGKSPKRQEGHEDPRIIPIAGA